MTFRYFAGILVILLAVGGCSDNGDELALRYDGVYMTAEIADDFYPYRLYLRFYPDGEVLSLGSTGRPEDIRTWFNKTNSTVSRGTVDISGASISFNSVSKAGAVRYWGEILSDGELSLHSQSPVDGYQSPRLYTFYPWTSGSSD